MTCETRRDHRNSRAFAVAATIWAVVIFKSSSSFVSAGQLAKAVAAGGGGHIDEHSFRIFWTSGWWVFVKGWHAAEFGVLYGLARLGLRKTEWMPVILASSYAISDEIHQIFVPDRGCRASDVCIDWLGILAVWAIFQWITQRRPRPWVCLTLVMLWIAAIYFLSIYPFGLIRLRGVSGNPMVPSLTGN